MVSKAQMTHINVGECNNWKMVYSQGEEDFVMTGKRKFQEEQILESELVRGIKFKKILDYDEAEDV